MSKYVVVTFPTEVKAYEGMRALQGLHDEGDLTVYAAAVLTKDAEGHLTLREEQDQGPAGTAVGSLIGGLIGAFGGPVGLAAGMAGGALIGSMIDLNDAGVGTEFLTDVAARLEEAQAAVVAEVEEGWVLPLDTRMEVLDGVVLRRHRIDVEAERLDREIDALNREMDELDAEIAQASAEAKAKLEGKRERARARLQKAQDRAKARVHRFQKSLR